LSQVKLYNAEELIEPNVSTISEEMDKDESSPRFRSVVDTFQDFLGKYASPNNFRFELINMNITVTLMGELGNAIPYDALFRYPLYEEKIVREMERLKKYEASLFHKALFHEVLQALNSKPLVKTV